MTATAGIGRPRLHRRPRRDPVEPRGEPIRPTDPIRLAGQDEERRLEGVLGVGRVAEEPAAAGLPPSARCRIRQRPSVPARPPRPRRRRTDGAARRRASARAWRRGRGCRSAGEGPFDRPCSLRSPTACDTGYCPARPLAFHRARKLYRPPCPAGVLLRFPGNRSVPRRARPDPARGGGQNPRSPPPLRRNQAARFSDNSGWSLTIRSRAVRYGLPDYSALGLLPFPKAIRQKAERRAFRESV